MTLSAKGLHVLKALADHSFSMLEDRLRDLFFDTTIRIITFTVVDESRCDPRLQDMLKKEVFRRYNSGITPLRRLDVERAVYINDDPTKYIKQKFLRNRNLYESFVRLLLAESDRDKLDDADTREKAAQEVRFLLIAAELPIMSARRKATFDEFYERFSEGVTDVQHIYKLFLAKLQVVLAVEEYFIANHVSGNRYWHQALFWGVAVLAKERVEIEQLKDSSLYAQLLKFYSENVDLFSPEESPFFYRQFLERFSATARFLGSVFQLGLEIYVRGSSQLPDNKSDELTVNNELAYLRIERQEPVPRSIDDICRLMLRRRFLVRPVYQRGEVINKTKSSAIIESILLGVKLPPLYIFERCDGTLEVIDGQQRLLSILGFAGLPFKDEGGNEMRSEKDGYALTHLRILDELNGKRYVDLDESMRSRILDFQLALIVIEERHNPRFDPVDLFIRLNSRPYPIKENTFEMWNSYVDKGILDEVKQVSKKSQDWFYMTKPEANLRMRNEELVAVLAYLEYRQMTADRGNGSRSEFMDLFRRESTIGVRIKQKNDVTNLLNQVTIDADVCENFGKCVRRVDAFIKRIRTILLDKEVDVPDPYLEAELTSMFNVQGKRHYARRFQDFYSLWYVASFLTTEIVNEKRLSVRRDLLTLLRSMKSANRDSDALVEINRFAELAIEFREKYAVDSRKIRLTTEEKSELIRQQSSQCPICAGPLFIHDELAVDHERSLAKGGKDHFLNLRVTHKHCNLKKGPK